MKKNYILAIIVSTLFCGSEIFSQNVGVNSSGTTPNTSTVLDLNTGNTFTSPNGKGLLIPNVSLVSAADGATIVSPSASLLVYNTNAAMTNGSGVGFYYNAGTSGAPNWVRMLNGSGTGVDWLTNGNTLTGTLPGTPNEWIGTSNAADFLIKTNTITQLRIRSTGTAFFTNDVSLADNSVPNERLRVLDGTGNRTTVGIVNNVLTTGTALEVSSTSTGPGGAISQTDKLINLSRTGANSFATHISYGIFSNIANTGATSTNIAGYFSATGATNNYALRLGGSTSGTLDISPAATTTSYSLVMPSAQGAASTVLTNNGSGTLSWSAVSGGGGGVSAGFQVFTASGTFVLPAGVTRVMIEIWGAGGGGGGGKSGGAGEPGSGGGGGAYNKSLFTVASNITVTIGAGGAGGAGGASGANGTAGGATSVSGGAAMSAGGGAGGTGNDGAGTLGAGGTPTATSSSVLGITGYPGGAQIGGGTGGPGGQSPAGGAGGQPNGTPGYTGSVPGGGGGGGTLDGALVGYAGGAGAAGMVIVWW